MKHSHILIIVVLLFGLSACNSGGDSKKSTKKTEATKVDYMHKEVMRIHDEVMPRMEEIAALQTEIKNTVDSLSNLEPQPEELIEELKMKKLSLDATAAAMMSWMKSYRTPQDDTSEEKAIQYLEEEKEKIKAIKADFEKTIAENEAYLERFED